MKEKGHNPVARSRVTFCQGSTYITSHNNARSLVRKVERDEILEELIKAYVHEGTAI